MAWRNQIVIDRIEIDDRAAITQFGAEGHQRKTERRFRSHATTDRCDPKGALSQTQGRSVLRTDRSLKILGANRVRQKTRISLPAR